MKIVGIDLGTTNSCVYYLDDDATPVLVMPQGRHKFFPSAVWCAGPGKDVVVGHAAKARLGQNPPPVVAVKRKMGTTETVRLGGQQVTAVDVSAHILGYARRLVEEATKDQVGGVVVTVPAYFHAAPNNDTHLAAVRAFFDGDERVAKGRIELQLEPEVAAYAYATDDPADNLRVLVYDLGGGTFDVSVLERSPEAGLRAVKFGGDPHLGGDNVDDRVAAWLVYLLCGGRADALDRILDPARYDRELRYTILQQLITNDVDAVRTQLRPEDRELLIPAKPLFDLALDPLDFDDLRRVQTLKRLAEQAKIDLTTTVETAITKQGAFDDKRGETVDIDLSLSRADFDRLVGDFIERTIECTQTVVREARLTPDAFDRILLVGGSTRMPIVREELGKIFDRPIVSKEPDLIVARGATLRARALAPPPIGVTAGDAELTLDYPRETADERITIRGVLRAPVMGHAFLMRGQDEVSHAAVDGDRFQFRDVPLQANTANRFRIEVTDAREQAVPGAEADLVVHHSDRALSSDRVAPKITRPVRALGVRGYHTLFPEGEQLPATRPFVCFRASQEDFIDIEFYEGERHLATLHLPGVDPRLPVGAAIDLDVTVSATYAVRATATVRDTKQLQAVDFAITRLVIPPLAQMDRDLQDILGLLDNDLARVRDVNRQTELRARRTRLAAAYTKARREHALDLHKLYATIGELRTLLIEVRAAQVLLEPPLEETLGLCGVCRGLAAKLKDDSAVRKEDVLERIRSLERAATEAWKAEDAGEYTRVVSELRQLREQTEEALKPPGRDTPPPSAAVIHAAWLRWLDEVAAEAKSHELGDVFAGPIEAARRAVRGVDLRDDDEARNALFRIRDDMLKPLANRLAAELKKKDGSTKGGLPDFPKVER